jgi:hypothetical protein
MKTRFINMLIPIVWVVLTLTWFFILNANSHAPVPKNASKTWSELIIGKWEYAELTVDGVKIDILNKWTKEFTREGKFIECASYPPRTESNYRIERDMIVDPKKPSIESNLSGEIWNSTTRIESLTEDKLVMVLTIEKRYDLETAKSLASATRPVEYLMTVPRIETQRTVFTRIKSE